VKESFENSRPFYFENVLFNISPGFKVVFPYFDDPE
jgi:hypothetical protein